MTITNNFQLMARNLGESLQRNSPSIFATFAVLGVGSTTLLAIRATRPALEALDQFEADWENFYDNPDASGTLREITNVDRFKLLVPFYFPTMASAAITIACILASNKINMERHAALATLYSASERALFDYQEKATELFGKRKEEKLSEARAQDKLNKNPIDGVNVYVTGKGEHLCYDSWSGRYFKSDLESIRQAVNEFNAEILQGDGFKTLNEFYADIGLDPIEGGQQMGWSLDTELLRVRFTAKIATDGEPCIVLEFPVNPRYL